MGYTPTSMCGRFSFGTTDANLATAFGVGTLSIEFSPRYNVAPTDPIAVIANRGSEVRIGGAHAERSPSLHPQRVHSVES